MWCCRARDDSPVSPTRKAKALTAAVENNRSPVRCRSPARCCSPARYCSPERCRSPKKSPARRSPKKCSSDGDTRSEKDKALGKTRRGIAVMLHIYDLGPVAKWTLNGNAQNTGIGVFHCGVELLGIEFSFQAIFNSHEHSEVTGIVCHTPRSHPRHVYRESIPLGASSLCLAEIESLMAQLKKAWPASSYHFLNRNCIDFAETFTAGLGVPEPFPKWAHGLAKGLLQRTPLANANSQLNCLGSCSSSNSSSKK